MTRRWTVPAPHATRTTGKAAIALAALLTLAGCSAGTSPGTPVAGSLAPTQAAGVQPTPPIIPPTINASSSPDPAPSPTSLASVALRPPSRAPSATAGPLVGNGVTLFFETSDIPDASAQTELVTAAGRHVYIDLLNVAAEARKPTVDDVLLITHYHPDHEDPMVIDSFPGQKLVAAAGTISLPEVRITGIPAAHTEGDAITDKDATDYIFLVEVGGVRIAHFGDLGQKSLTPSQMQALGRVDVAISQLQNPYSGMDEGSTLGFDQMHQVNPRIFMPTHLWSSAVTARAAAKQWPALMSPKASIHLTPKSLPASTTVLFMGLNAQQFGKLLRLKPATW